MAIQIHYETIISNLQIGDEVTIIVKGITKDFVVSQISEHKIKTETGESGNSVVSLEAV